MTIRYFKATDGERTVFRASKTRIYRSATIGKGGISFSRVEGNTLAGVALHPAAEIDKAEYDRLVAAKAARIARDFAARHPGEDRPSWIGSSPQDSWVRNSEIA